MIIPKTSQNSSPIVSQDCIAYSGADQACCPETHQSTYIYSVFLGGNLISWSAKKQQIVARSSYESEYRALSNVASKVVWITHLLKELHSPLSDPPRLLCNNNSDVFFFFLSQNPVAHKRAKHIDIDYHFVHELISSRHLFTQFIPSHLQIADIFTKGLARSLFEFFHTKLRVIYRPMASLRGVIADIFIIFASSIISYLMLCM